MSQLPPPPEPATAPPSPEAEIAAILRRGRSRGWTRRILVFAVVAVVAVGGWLWWSSRSAASATSYTTIPVARGDVTVSVIAAGTIQPINQVDVSSELSGTIGAVNVDFNAPVKAGQTLATLKTDKLAAAVEQGRATLAARVAEVAQAKAASD